MKIPVGLLFIWLLVCHPAYSDLKTQRYEKGEVVEVYVNTIGPYHNPQETYPFHTLPYCRTHERKELHEGLGEALLGYELVLSPFMIYYLQDMEQAVQCSKEYSGKDIDLFISAIEHEYWYQAFIDDLPIWGKVGSNGNPAQEHADTKQYFLYTHTFFTIEYNNDRIISIKLSSQNPVQLIPHSPQRISFSYGVKWVPVDTAFEDRFLRYLDTSLFEHNIHWFSMLNSFMIVIVLVALVALVLTRTLGKSFVPIGMEEEGNAPDNFIEESGWKQVKGDVFRTPYHILLLSVLLGNGFHLLVMILCTVGILALGTYYEQRGVVISAFMICYVLTQSVSGYIGGAYYKQGGGKAWVKQVFMSTLFFPGLLTLLFTTIQLFAFASGTSNYIPFHIIIKGILVVVFISIPSTIGGTLLGRAYHGNANHPVRINPFPRSIPIKKWYFHPVPIALFAGLLSFGSIFMELYFIFSAFYKYYYVFGYVGLMYCVFLTVTICVSIVSTYLLLNAEDYRWQWSSFLTGGSSALYVLIYAVYYYFVRTHMHGFLQLVYYFSYVFIFAAIIFLIGGAAGFLSAHFFVHRIYSFKFD